MEDKIKEMEKKNEEKKIDEAKLINEILNPTHKDQNKENNATILSDLALQNLEKKD